MCRNKLEENSLLEPAPEDPGEEEDFDAESQSSKTEAMLQILKATMRKEGSKVVVFSQWTSFLNIIEAQLKAEGIGYTRIDGSMKADKRDKAIEALDNDPETRVMLASLSVCSVGLNLVAADTVILSDSCKYHRSCILSQLTSILQGGLLPSRTRLLTASTDWARPVRRPFFASSWRVRWRNACLMYKARSESW